MNLLKVFKQMTDMTNTELETLFKEMNAPILASTIASRVRSKSGRETLQPDQIDAIRTALFDSKSKDFKQLKKAFKEMELLLETLSISGAGGDDITDDTNDADDLSDDDLFDDDLFDDEEPTVDDDEIDSILETALADDDETDELDGLFSDVEQDELDEADELDELDDLFSDIDTPSGQAAKFSEGGDWDDKFDSENKEF